MNAILKKEWLEILRTRKMFVLLIVFLFVAISSPILAKLIPTIFSKIDMQGINISIPDPTWQDALDQFVKNLSQIAFIVLVFLFAGSVAEEKNKKTLEMVLSKPIPRSRYILAKFFIALLSSLLVYAVAAMIFYFYAVSIFGGFSLIDFILVAICLFVYLAQAVVVTIFSSVLSSNQILSAGLAFFSEIVIVTILGNINKIAKYSPGYILSNYRDLMQSGDISGQSASLITSLIIIFLAILSSIQIFKKQEVER